MKVSILDVLLCLVGTYILYFIYRTVLCKRSADHGDNDSDQATDSQADASEVDDGLIPMRIFYGSQGGTAIDYSQVIEAEARDYGFRPELVDLEDYQTEEHLSSEQLAVFVMATYGEGDPTDNAEDFCMYIFNEEERAADECSGMRYAVFGLGNRQYQHFCAIGRKVDARMEAMGAQRLCKHGEGDEHGNQEADFDAWKATFWPAVTKAYGISLPAAGSSEQAGGVTHKFHSQLLGAYFPREKGGGYGAGQASSVASDEKTCDSGLTPLLGTGMPQWVAEAAAERKGQTAQFTHMFHGMKEQCYFVPVTRNIELRQKPHDPKDAAGGATRHLEFDLQQPTAMASPLSLLYQTFTHLAGQKGGSQGEQVLGALLRQQQARHRHRGDSAGDAKGDSSASSSKHSDSDAGLYQTADNLAVFPRNQHARAARMCKFFGVHPQSVLVTVRADDWKHAQQPGALSGAGDISWLSKHAKAYPVPPVIRAIDIFLYYCDIEAIPRGHVLATLSQFAGADKERARLLRWAKGEGRAELESDMMSTWEVFEACPSLRVPLHYWVQFMPEMQPRYYTISSSALYQGGKAVSVTVTSDRTAKPRGRVHDGVCSTYMLGLRPGDRAAVFVRASKFRLPSHPDVGEQEARPVVMVGPGTGIAPFRAFIEEVLHLRSGGQAQWPSDSEGERKGSGGGGGGGSSSDGEHLAAAIGPVTLYFGCRQRDRDYLYKRDLHWAVEHEYLDDLRPAFSREVPGQKVYVQDLIRTQSRQLWDALYTRGGYLYVCGATAMGNDVWSTVAKIARAEGKLSAEEAEAFLQELVQKDRYVQELWS